MTNSYFATIELETPTADGMTGMTSVRINSRAGVEFWIDKMREKYHIQSGQIHESEELPELIYGLHLP